MHKSTVLIAMIILSACFGAAYAQVPPNDECTGSTVISALPYHATQNTRLATPNAADPILQCADSGGGKTVWYKWTADSTGYVKFTTVNSTPSTYDVALGLLTGSCGSLTLVDCNDDINPGTVRQAEITFFVQAGTAYILHVAEWKGGGPQGGIPTGGDLVLDVYWSSLEPLSKGPKAGMVIHGATVSTDGYEASLTFNPEEGQNKRRGGENDEQILFPPPPDVMPPLAPRGTNLKPDKFPEKALAPQNQPVIFKSFQGNTFTGYIPPDPILAVGPNHVIGVVNSSFNIWDKNGQLLKSISLDSWYHSVKPSVGFSDPQVLYDHYAHRWIIGGGGFSEPYAFLISVSDDDNPLGYWTNWALPAGLGDSLTGNLPDYPQMGYDEQAIYITSREYNPGFLYSRVRIIGTSQLYGSSPDTLRWVDIWDLREPDHRTVPLDGIRPSIEYGAPGVHFMIAACPYNPGTFFTVYRINDPLGTPSMEGKNVPVVEYLSAPNPGQLGGGIPFEGGGSVVRHKALYRDSSLWVVHSIANGAGDAHSALHYVRINPWTCTNQEDAAMGTDGYWYFYPALTLDYQGNMFVTYTRTGDDEYAGAYVAGRGKTDPPGLSPSIPLKIGLGNYSLDYGGGRNRWGDYNGICLDPSDSTIAWANTEYATVGNQWGTWLGQMKMAPISGKYIYTQPLALKFDATESGKASDTLRVTVINYGLDTLTISSVMLADSNFMLVNLPALPLGLGSFDVLNLAVLFIPKTTGSLAGPIVINSNDAARNPQIISLSGSAYYVQPVQAGVMYAGSGNLDSGKVLTVSATTGEAASVGPSGYETLNSIRVNPATHELLGLTPSGVNTILARVNSALGDAHPASIITQQLLKGMAFRGDTLYVGRINGALFRVDIQTGAAVQIASTGINIFGLDFNPLTGQLWVSGQLFSGGSNDRVYKISLPSGTPTVVGSTGLGTLIKDIVFDASGNLFGLTSNSYQSNLILIDTLTGKASVIGSLGHPGVQCLALDPATRYYTHKFDLASSWNMVSLPLSVGNKLKKTMFPSAVSDAFAYEGSYIIQDTLELGSGYWVKFAAPSVRMISGTPFSSDTIGVRKSWNMIGSISEPVISSSIASDSPGIITSNLFGYNGDYYIADTLKPGFGYWIKVNQSGRLILSSGSSALAKVPANRIQIVPTGELPPPPPDVLATTAAEVPGEYGLDQAYPNPFNPSTTIKYGLPAESKVSLKVYSLLGQLVSVLKDGNEIAGYRQIEWNANNIASGVYFYKLDATSVADPGRTFTSVKKVLLLK